MTNNTHNDITKPTTIFGESDDLIEFEGGIYGEVNHCDSSSDEPTGIFLSDGSVLSMYYDNHGVWHITVEQKGTLFDRLEECPDDGEDEKYSDIAHFKPGLKWAYAVRCDEDLQPVS